MKKIILSVLVFLCVLSSSSAQKVKYKDLFPLLNDKNYAEGEPKLRAFLANSKNASHPNANLQMALLLERKIRPLKIVADSSKIIQYCDTLLIFLAKAKTLITDREVKKNSKYYKSYERRDLRTGNVTIKSSDVRGDLDDKQKYHQRIRRGASFLGHHLPRLENSQEKSRQIFQELTSQYDSEVSFALSIEQEEKDQLQVLKQQNQNTKSIVSDIQDQIASLPEVGFNADEDLVPIQEFGKDGLTNKAVYEGSFQIWEYDRFVNRIITSSEGEIALYKKSLLDENRKIDRLISGIERAVIPPDRPAISSVLLEQSQSIDPDNFPIAVLKFKEQESLFKLLDLKDEDQSHIYLQLSKYDSLEELIGNARTSLQSIIDKNTVLEKLKYREFVRKVFNRESQVDKYIEDQKLWTRNQSGIVEQQINQLRETVRWGVNRDDSVAVFLEGQDTLRSNMSLYIDEDTTYYKVVGGFEIAERPFKAFFSRVDPGMNLLWKYTIPTAFDQLDSLTTRNFFQMIPGKSGLITFHYTIDDQNYQFVALDKMSGEEQWSVTTQLDEPVVDVKFNELTNETVVFLTDPDNPAQGEEVKYVVIDKAGKVRK